MVKQLRRPEGTIHYEVYGQGPAIVFAHGLGGNHLSWWQQLPHFAQGHTCVVFSHRGFVPSSPVPGASAPDAYADDLAALIDELGLADVTLVAQSMGGWTSLEYALRHPAKVRALVMASTSGAVDIRQLTGEAAAGVAAWMERTPRTLADLEARGILAAHGERMAREQPAAAMLYRQISQLTPRAFRDEVRARIFAMRVQPPSVLARLTMPVLFLTGDEDCVFPAAAGPGLAALVPRGKAVNVERAGHSVYFERPRQFNRIVDEFLQAG